MPETSLLLGAGFSVNKGYPTASKLNEKLLQLDPEDFWVHTDGTVSPKSREEKDPCWYSSESKYKHFAVRLIQYYNQRIGNFNYEEFYDFYNEIYRGEKFDLEFEKFCDEFRKEFNLEFDNKIQLRYTNIILNQLILHFLVDSDNNLYYAPVSYSKPIYPGYTGFLSCLEKWGEDNVVHIHTLNHDLFFEIFKDSDWLQSKLSDGFQELGSPYYGENNDNHRVRLSFFSNEYAEKYRLYKLHGSVDQLPFHIKNCGIDTYIKTKYGINTSLFFKEIRDESDKLSYLEDSTNFHPDFLSGTTSKILRYSEPIYYKKVFNHFESNLSRSNALIAIGYGCRDVEINNLIEMNFNYKAKPVYIVDPYPSSDTEKFIKRFNGILIKKSPESMKLSDFNIISL